jgi:hypothetical protein
MQKIGVVSVAELVWLAQKATVAPAQPGIGPLRRHIQTARHDMA